MASEDQRAPVSDPMPETRETVAVECLGCGGKGGAPWTDGSWVECETCEGGKVLTATLTGRDALVMALGRMLLAETDDDFIPDHDCGFVHRPDTGYCRFHDKWFEARCALSAFDAARKEPDDA